MKLLLILFIYISIHSQTTIPNILSMKQRAEVRDQWLADRLETVLPKLMDEEKIDMWIIIAREYNEDPVIRTMLPAKWINARRRTILVFSKSGETVEKLAVARYDVGIFKKAWDKEAEPNQWKRLADLIQEKNPKTIGLNLSETYAHADGLTKTEYDQLIKHLNKSDQSKIKSAETLAVRWLETRSEMEMTVYPQIVKIAHRIILEGLSEQVIQPGITTTDDVQWWYRERIRELKLITWFHPSVSTQRADKTRLGNMIADRDATNVIMPGDLIHIDFGITYLGLNTDTQEHAYVLYPGETAAPKGLREALVKGNRLQDILTSHIKSGRSGNQILKATLDQAKKEGLRPSVYTHPIGFHGHAAGPAIGMWDAQGGVAGTGDFMMHANTAYSIELNVTVAIPEWNNKDIRIMLEEDGFYTGSDFYYIDGRQKELILIPRSEPTNRQ